jgi:hypothetical protein
MTSEPLDEGVLEGVMEVAERRVKELLFGLVSGHRMGAFGAALMTRGSFG